MGDEDDGWWCKGGVELKEVFLEPDYAEQIEEVGRLVEDQDVGGREEG